MVEAAVNEISELMDDYVQYRSKTGTWLEASKVYGAYWHLKGSIETENGRFDTFVFFAGNAVDI